MSKIAKLFIISAPSGAGKTTVANYILSEFQDRIVHVITCTTRPMREGEIDGVAYHFLSKEEFKRLEEKQEFIETKVIYENYYGTPKKEIEENLKSGKSVLLVIDVEGAKEIIEKNEFSIVSIFLVPPSIEELERRINKRGTESQNSLKKRIGRATKEISYKDQYDFVIENNDLEKTCEEVRNILKSETQNKDGKKL